METKVMNDKHQAIDETYDTDILVVGGGISGLVTLLKQDTKKVLKFF